MTIGVYAGSFDPFTLGHYNVALSAGRTFDHVVVAVGVNPKKKGLFTTEERIEMIRESMGFWTPDDMWSPANYEYVSFEGLLVDFCASLKKERKAKVTMVRGLRAVSDFEAEMAIADANRRLARKDHVPTVFVPTRAEQAFVSSSIVKEIASIKSTANGASNWADPLYEYVTPAVARRLRKHFGSEDRTQEMIDNKSHRS